MYLFCDRALRNKNGSSQTFTKNIKIYQCIIKSQNITLKYFIPCYRKSDNIIGMYDIINNSFHTSLSANDFTKGNNINNYFEGVCLENAAMPSYYQPVEYIASSGTQYIDLDYICKTNNLNIELDMAWTGTNKGAFETFAGFMYSTSQVTPRIGLHKYSSKLMFGANATQSSGTEPAVNERFLYKGDFASGAQKLYKNGSQLTTTSTTYDFSTNTCPLYLFARYCPNSMNYATMKLYSCIIKEGTTTVRNLVPCYSQVTSEIGLYDLITKTFYTNSGTGNFTKGNDITLAATGPMMTLSPALPEITLLPKIYRRLSYIANTGEGVNAAYLDTGLPVHMNWKYELVFQQNTASTFRAWGAFNQSSYQGPNCSLTYVGNSFAIRWESRANQYTSQSFTAVDTNKHTFIVDNGYPTFDGQVYTRTAGHNDSFAISYNAYLFTINPGGTTLPTSQQSFLKGKIYSYKVWDNNGILQQWFIPCENKITGEAGMYDIIKQEFHNSASGKIFQKGEVI